MFVIITKNGKPIEAFMHTSGSGIIMIEYDSPIAKLYLTRLETVA